LHKKRRRAFDPYFSKGSVLKLEPMITTLVAKLCSQIERQRSSGKALNMSLLYRCLTSDLISEYCFSQPFDLLDDPEGHEEFMKAFTGVFKFLYMMEEFWWMKLGLSFLALLPKRMIPTNATKAFVETWMADLRHRLRSLKEGLKGPDAQSQHDTVFAQYIKSSNVPAAEKTDECLYEHAVLFVSAGLETTGFALSTATYHILAHGDLCSHLKGEVSGVWASDGTPPSWTTLERLPILSACIKEALRLGLGVMSRRGRINSRRAMQYKQWTLPAGTVVSMSQRFILYDEEIFPEPAAFRPGRWLQGTQSTSLEKWLVVFSKGSRNCIGQKYAHCRWRENSANH
jgi:cytochrome P450